LPRRFPMMVFSLTGLLANQLRTERVRVLHG